jgi:glycolate oxidase FAD binding subunit
MAVSALTLEDTLAHLASIVGAESAHLEGETIAVSPADTTQVAEVLRLANKTGLTVEPRGGGTKLNWGNPVSPRIRLALDRMNTLLEHSWQDMTCGVQAGCTWAAMQAKLARHGQMVALDPLWPERATVGGITAVNDSGALRLKYGGLRDLIIGMTVVLADGTIARSGGKVVKNVAGYDLHKLMTGSFGTLGVIVSVNFRLHPMEKSSCTWSTAPCDATQLEAPLRALLDSQIVPTSVQIRTAGARCILDIRIAASPQCLSEHVDRLAKIFDPVTLREADDAVRQTRHNLFDSGGGAILKVSLLPAEICTVLSQIGQRASVGAEISAVAQATGLMHVALKAAPDQTIAFIEHLRQLLHRSAGSVTALQLPAAVGGNVDLWGCDSSALPLMREIKRRFDPNRILNPGRFVGNI